MQQNVPSGPNYEQQPALPSYAEAIRAVPPPANLHYRPNVTGVEESYQPTAPVYGNVGQSIQYPGQSNYNQVPFPAAPLSPSHPATYTTSPYPQYGPTSGETGIGPTTIHIIRPVSTESTTCCSGRSGRILAIILSIVILGAILRVIMHSYF